MNVDFEKKPFSDKNADLKVYFGSNCVRGDGTYIGDLQPDPNQLLCAYYPGQVAREFIRVEKTKLEAEKRYFEERMNLRKIQAVQVKKKKKDEDLSRRLEQLEAKFGHQELENGNMKAEINQLKAGNQNMKAEINQLKAENQNMKAENKNMRVQHEGEIGQLKATVQQISNEIARLNVRALHRRVMLDDIRKAFVAQGVIQDDIKPTQNLNALTRIVSLVKEGLHKQGLRMLSDPAIMAIFDTNETTLRGIGNDVAHKASTKDIAEAVLDSGLSETDRKKATELFMWLNGRNPALQHTA
ncbi:hypothetical protein Clacol_004940 [Clathrus columnatus]|uniref:Uncharacterized protein n=1 Tax=Clathrus columnatus TaxID=1419009 RepID=A0AAV5AB58_9AGAM|nr:hypothetical protein Clacol_004940 [Clathrus columnatus]